MAEFCVEVELALRAWGYIEAPTEEEARTIAEHLLERRALDTADRFWTKDSFETSFEEVEVLNVEESKLSTEVA